jgi:hypothetical protein
MPPTKKHTLNSIFQYKSFNKSSETNTIIEGDKQVQTTNKSLDTYFNISDKPPSPIPEIIYDTHKDINQNTILTLSEIKNRILNLYENEMFEIFKIIKDNKEKYTTNNNGIFVNISTLKPITITEITKFLIFSDKNNKLLDKEEEERDLYRDLVS